MMDRISYLLRQDFGFLLAPSRYPFHRHLILRQILYVALLVFSIRLFWPGQLPLSSPPQSKPNPTETNSMPPVQKSSEIKKEAVVNDKGKTSNPHLLSEDKEGPLLELPTEESKGKIEPVLPKEIEPILEDKSSPRI